MLASSKITERDRAKEASSAMWGCSQSYWMKWLVTMISMRGACSLKMSFSDHLDPISSVWKNSNSPLAFRVFPLEGKEGKILPSSPKLVSYLVRGTVRWKITLCFLIFFLVQDLAVLVHDQGLQLDTIDSNITRVADHTQVAGGELVRAEQYQRSARNRMCYILVVVAIVMAILVLVLTSWGFYY